MNRRPDPLFVFERLAALEKSLAALREERRSHPPVRAHGQTLDTEQASDPGRRPDSRLARTLEEIASLDGDSPDSGRRAVALALAALRR